MVITNRNPLLALDVYKMGHMEQYAPGCTKVYSYLTARYDRIFKNSVFFGLQYYIKEYFSVKLTREMGDEFLKYRKMILGVEASEDIKNKIYSLCDLGYFPLEIKAVEEGTAMPVKNVLMTMTNTLPEFYWTVGFVESLILKLWYPITVASCCYKYRQLVNKYFDETVDNELQFLRDFTVHDFGYRGDSSEEGAAISGAAHLISFKGSDTVPSLPFIICYYHANENNLLMASVPASEHSVICSFGKDNEFEAFENMLKIYPKGIVSIVSDTYDFFNVLTNFAIKLKDKILNRDGKIVFRPDSGNQEYIICGDPNADPLTPQGKGAIKLLEEIFGSTINSKGFKQLNPKIGLIYGDGMYYDKYEKVLERMKSMGYASSNLVIGVGGILRNHSRDSMGFALKATYVEINNIPREIEKNPVTDSTKKSHRGLLSLQKNNNGEYLTSDCCTFDQEENSLLKTIYKNGILVKELTWDKLINNIKI